MDWEIVKPFPADGQYLTARWLNRIIRNLATAHAYAVYGASVFRRIKWAVPSRDTWATCWRGYYKHQNAGISLIYSIYRSNQNDFDNAWGWETNPMGFEPEPTQLKLQMFVSGEWKDLGTVSTSSAVSKQTLAGSFVGLWLTIGATYPVRVIGLNGGIGVDALYGHGSANAWPGLPTVADTTVLHAADFNKYVDALGHIKQVLDSPRCGTWGIIDRQTKDAGNGFSYYPWRGMIRHRSNTLKYRFGARQANGFTAELYLNGVKIDGEAESSAEYKYVESWHDLSDHGLTVGQWYEVDLKVWCDSADTTEAVLDYVFEVDGEPGSALSCSRWQHGNYVCGNTAGVNPRLELLNADFSTVKANADQAVQLLCPDVVSDGSWPHASTNGNDLNFIRQRDILAWSGAGVTINWSDGSSAQSQALPDSWGYVDLRALNGLDRGRQYWLSPRASVVAAWEE